VADSGCHDDFVVFAAVWSILLNKVNVALVLLAQEYNGFSPNTLSFSLIKVPFPLSKIHKKSAL